MRKCHWKRNQTFFSHFWLYKISYKGISTLYLLYGNTGKMMKSKVDSCNILTQKLYQNFIARSILIRRIETPNTLCPHQKHFFWFSITWVVGSIFFSRKPSSDKKECYQKFQWELPEKLTIGTVKICWIKIIHNSVHFWDGKSILFYIFFNIRHLFDLSFC